MTDRRSLIVIGGGEAGALEALCLLEGVPVPIQARIVIAIGDPLRTANAMMALLQGCTRLLISTAMDGELMQLGRVYLAPRGYHLAVAHDSRALLQRGDLIHGKRPAADVLFSSAAKHFGSQVIGIILSGGKEDGVSGFREIRATGGLRLIQSPSTGVNPSMPLHGVLEDHPDLLCAPKEMGPLLGLLLKGEDSF